MAWITSCIIFTSENYFVSGTFSNPEREDECDLLPFPATRISFSETEISGQWNTLVANSDILVIAIPPKRNVNGEVLFDQYIQHIINQTPSNKKIIFISSTSVYGNLNTKITEDTTPQPVTASGQSIYKSEQLLTDHFKSNLTILRCSGLLGPKRHPGRFLAGRKNMTNPNGLVNMVHQQDCIQIIHKIIEQHAFGHVFNLCSDEHPTRQTFYTKAAKHIQLTPPEFIEDHTPSYKYIDNSKSKTILNHKYLSIDDVLEMC